MIHTDGTSLGNHPGCVSGLRITALPTILPIRLTKDSSANELMDLAPVFRVSLHDLTKLAKRDSGRIVGFLLAICDELVSERLESVGGESGLDQCS